MAIAQPQNRAAELALAIYQGMLAELAPERLIQRVCRTEESSFHAGELSYDLSRYRHVYVCGAGKASAGLARAVSNMVGPHVSGGLVITKYGHGVDLGPVEVRESGHPTPDQASLDAGEAMLTFAGACGEGDLVIFVLSGGASALMEALEPGVDLTAMVATTKRLLASGASIHEINKERCKLSRIKGGKLADAFGKSDVLCLVLSDVAGDDFSVIGSGPLWQPNGHRIPHVLVGGPWLVPKFVESTAKKLGVATKRRPDFQGEARKEAKVLAEGPREGHPGCLFSVGETVVKIRGKGKGGRCQEFACAAAGLIRGKEGVAVLAAGTDGTDGPTDFAGGLVDGGSAARAEARGISVAEALAENDSSRFLEACGGLIKTGPTQSNVDDVYMLIEV